MTTMLVWMWARRVSPTLLLETGTRMAALGINLENPQKLKLQLPHG